VRDAYLDAGHEEEWPVYLAELVDDHQRKYKLRPMLEDLKWLQARPAVEQLSFLRPLPQLYF
jgi:hypothetical protein